MRIRTLFLLTSLTGVFACGGDDDDTATTVVTTVTDTDPSTSGTETLTTSTTATESSSSGGETLTTSTTATESGSESDSGSSGADSSESGSGSESGGVSICEQYCLAYEANCTDAEVSTQYADHDACLAACAGWPAGTAEDTTGNTQGCHLYHVNAAAGDPGTHCPHTQEVPDGGCV